MISNSFYNGVVEQPIFFVLYMFLYSVNTAEMCKFQLLGLSFTLSLHICTSSRDNCFLRHKTRGSLFQSWSLKLLYAAAEENFSQKSRHFLCVAVIVHEKKFELLLLLYTIPSFTLMLKAFNTENIYKLMSGADTWTRTWNPGWGFTKPLPSDDTSNHSIFHLSI